jgi:hypothetical protein
MPEYMHRVEKCLKCGGLADILVEERYSGHGHLVARLIHRFRCRRGCTGRGVVHAPGAPR